MAGVVNFDRECDHVEFIDVLLGADPDEQWQNRLVVRHVPLDLLWPTVKQMPHNPRFQERLRDSLKADGQKNPLVVAWSSPEVVKHVLGDEDKARNKLPPRTMWCIVVGSQRYWAMRDLGWTTCDVAIAHGIWEAQQFNKVSKLGFEDMYA